MKPVAWLYINPYNKLKVSQLDGEDFPVFTADQLRAAQVEILREAAKKIELEAAGEWQAERLRSIADELEAKK